MNFLRLTLVLALAPLTTLLAQEKPEETGGVARVLLASPSTTFEGKAVGENQVLTTIGTFKTGTEGGAKLKLISNEVLIELAANSEIKLSLSARGDPSEAIELVKGRARVRVPKNKTAQPEKPRFMLRHRKTTMGVRGTDFVVVTHEAFDEIELAVFEGKVEWTQEGAPQKSQLVSGGFWLGWGGRFGTQLGSPLRLSPKALEYLQSNAIGIPSFQIQKLETPTPPKDANSSGKIH